MRFLNFSTGIIVSDTSAIIVTISGTLFIPVGVDFKIIKVLSEMSTIGSRA